MRVRTITTRAVPLALMLLLAASVAQRASAATIAADETLEARRFVSVALEGKAFQNAERPGIEVLSNYDAVQKNSRFGKPLKLSGKPYTQGLFCHAPSKLLVRLPGPAKRFEAIVGVDSNEQTAGGRGSVVFSVQANGKELFHSAKLTEATPAVPVNIELGGASEFILEASDGGDGISADQADWAEAKITLADGRTLGLDELPTTVGPTALETGAPFFSFVYDGKPSAELLPTWKVERASKKLDEVRTERTIVYTDPKTGLVVRCVAIEYRDFPTVEWTLYFKNPGTKETPILENIQAVDLPLARGHYGEFLLHHAVGSPCLVNDFQPLATDLVPNSQKRITAAGGRATCSDMAFFNLEVPTGSGVIVAVGWPGQWASSWARDAATGLRLQAGMELTHLKLLPGEEIRTPLIALQFWTQDWLHAQNVWRQWMLAHNVPKPNGKLPQPELFGCSSHLFSEMCDANEANQKECIDRYLAEKIPIGHWWMDAGWYPCDVVSWPKTGTWEVDKRRFPNGLRAISDYAHTKGVQTIVWFEPERVSSDTWLTKNHPEWILGGVKEGQGNLLDLGNPEALRWLIDHIDGLIKAEGIDLYRQDFNIDPLTQWRAADAPDRQGITEIRHIEGYLAYSDALLKRNPSMYLDTCASGGRRLDLETLRRAIPLWRTDFRCDPTGTQCHSFGLSLWVPLSGTGAADVNAYTFRSNMVPFTNLLLDIRSKTNDYDLLRRLVAEWQQIAPFYVGDYYPLTEFSATKDSWMAWQFHQPETGEGCVQAFRREKCIFEVGRLPLKGVERDARYRVTDLTSQQTQEVSGAELLDRGVLVTIAERPGAVVLRYGKVK